MICLINRYYALCKPDMAVCWYKLLSVLLLVKLVVVFLHRIYLWLEFLQHLRLHLKKIYVLLSFDLEHLFLTWYYYIVLCTAVPGVKGWRSCWWTAQLKTCCCAWRVCNTAVTLLRSYAVGILVVGQVSSTLNKNFLRYLCKVFAFSHLDSCRCRLSLWPQWTTVSSHHQAATAHHTQSDSLGCSTLGWSQWSR